MHFSDSCDMPLYSNFLWNCGTFYCACVVLGTPKYILRYSEQLKLLELKIKLEIAR